MWDGIAHPASEPLEALLAHAFGQNGDAVAAKDAGDRNAAAAIISGRRPDRMMASRIEAARYQPDDEARVGRQHFVRADHREAGSEHQYDRSVDARERLREHDMVGDRNRVAPIRRIAPVDAPKIVRMRRVGVNVRKAGGDMLGNRRARRELRKRRQHDLLRSRTFDRRAADHRVDNRRRVGEPDVSGFVHSAGRPSLFSHAERE